MKKEIKTIEQVEELGLSTYSYSDEDWEYKDNDGYYHFFRNGEELLPEIKKFNTHAYPNGDWEYEDTNNEWHAVKGNNNEN